VADHILGNVNGQEAAAVMDVEVKADEVGSDCGAARPCLDRLAVVIGLGDAYLFSEVGIDKETFFYGTRHSWLNRIIFSSIDDRCDERRFENLLGWTSCESGSLSRADPKETEDDHHRRCGLHHHP